MRDKKNPVPRLLLPSHLHEVSGAGLGRAPLWLYPDDACGGVSPVGCFGGILIIGAIVGTVFAIQRSPLWLMTWLVVPLAVWLIRYDNRFLSRERFARARIRRHECIQCGVKLDVESEHYCRGCIP